LLTDWLRSSCSLQATELLLDLKLTTSTLAAARTFSSLVLPEGEDGLGGASLLSLLSIICNKMTAAQ
jgi:hypothetical protein